MPLTDKQIKSFYPEEKPRRYFDGDGLYLEVAPNGSKLWRVKYRFGGKEKRLSIGKYPQVSLKDARTACLKAKELLASGIDPSGAKRSESPQTKTTFATVAEEWFAKYAGEVSEVSGVILHSRLRRYVLPQIGTSALEEILPKDVLSVCRGVESSVSAACAHKVLSDVSRIFRYAVANGYVPSDPCRDLKGALASHKGTNFPAIVRPGELGDLLLAVEGYSRWEVAKLATQMLILLMCRTGEMLKMRWEELDLENGLWRIPAAHTKMRRDHIVPLSRQALQILEKLRVLAKGSEFVFISRYSHKKYQRANKAIVLCVLRKLGYAKETVTGHGFRATASTLLNEMGWSPDVIEAQLAHFSQGAVRAAYNRAKYLDERRRMMQFWADYLDKLREEARERQAKK